MPEPEQKKPGLFGQGGKGWMALGLIGDALQSMDGREAVFVREGETYLTRHVETGARDTTQVQIRAGLSVGEDVVVAESYLIKADIGKAGVSDDD